MSINLKHISPSDGDNIKLDKVNYNFDQIIYNGGGPKGYQGTTGAQGPQGITGPQGTQGQTGTQGSTGAPGASSAQYWHIIPGVINNLTADTLMPFHTSSASTPNPPVVVSGFLDTDPSYMTAQSLAGGNVPYQWLINRKSNFSSNLRFTNDVLTSHFDFKISNISATNAVMSMGFDSTATTTSKIEWYAETHLFIDNITRSTLVSMDSGSIEYYVPIAFQDEVIISDTLQIDIPSAGIDKIAVSADSIGTIEFKSATELGIGVPQFTIISVSPEMFATTLPSPTIFFEMNQTIDASPGTAEHLQPLKIIVGRGINEWAGWYLCNGKTWKNAGGFFYQVPDLNSFNLSIQDNTSITNPDTGWPLSQGLVNEINPYVPIIGGAETIVNASQPGPLGVYDIQGGVDSSFTQFAGTQGNQFEIKQLPQVIFLGHTDLYWEEQGVPS